MISLVLGKVLIVPVFVIPVYAQQLPIAPPSNSTNLSPLSNSSMENQTGESLVESFGSPQALTEAVIGVAQKQGDVNRRVEEGDLLETDKTCRR